MSIKIKVYLGLNLPHEVLDLISKEGFNFEMWDKTGKAPIEELVAKSVDCKGILISSYHQITAKVMDTIGPQLKVISTTSTGYEHIDINAAKERGIAIGNTSTALAAGVAEYTIGVLIAMARQMFQAEKRARIGDWKCSLFDGCGNDIGGKVIGIIGFGGIGTAIAKRLVAFEPKKLLYCGPSEKSEASTFGAIYASFDQLLEESDYVIVSCSLNNTTRGLFEKSSFAKMKKSSMFINVSRGGIVNHDDLYEALINNTIKAAALDVTTPEPFPIDHPLFSIDNCVILPHIGSATSETRFAMGKLAVQNLIAGVNEKPLPQAVVV